MQHCKDKQERALNVQSDVWPHFWCDTILLLFLLFSLGMGNGDPGCWERQLNERAEHWLIPWPTLVGHLAVTLRVLSYE